MKLRQIGFNDGRHLLSTMISRLRMLMLVAILSVPGSIAAAQQPRQTLEAARIDPQVGQSLPLATKFVDHDGQSFRIGELTGKRPLVLCLVYFECPMLCKLAADGLVRSVSSLPENLGRDFDVVIVSFDPRDSTARAAAAREHAINQYARSGTDDGWHFLTGSQQNINKLTQAVGFRYQWDAETKQFSHAAGLMIVSPDGVITEYLDGVNFSPRDLISAVNRAAKNELTQRTSTSFVRCYLYDPTTGKFGAAVQWTIRVLGLFTVLTIVVSMIRLNRRARVQATQS